MRYSFCFFILLLLGTYSFAQTENETVNAYIERYIENTSDEVDIQQFASDLLFYYENPLNLNKADANDLFGVPFLTTFQALEIIEHRKQFGNFIRIYELQVLPSFSLQSIREILPFVTIKSSELSATSLRQIWHRGQHQILTLAETSAPSPKGVRIADTLQDLSTNHYSGSNLYSNFRYRFDYKKYISFGLNAEKDAGESFETKNGNKGYDYYSMYFAMQDVGKLKSLNLGDFQANFGQGLTLSTGLAFGKSSIITNAKRNFNGFGAYRSLRENAFLRGGAVSFELNQWQAGIFVSSKRVDGNGVFESDSSNEKLTELISTTIVQEDGGYHRTPSESIDKDILNDFQTGIYLEYKGNRGRIGTINYIRKLGATLQPNLKPYNAFNFAGNRYMKNGVYYDYVFRNINLYGEVSHSSHDHSFAQIHGALVSLHRFLDLSFVYRNYDRSFITMQSNGFGEASNTSNENGLYVGFQSKISQSISILGYYDLYKFPWLRFQADAPSSGNDFWLEMQYKPNRKFKAYYRYRAETKQVGVANGAIEILNAQTIARHRFQAAYTLSKGVELRNRIEWSYATLSAEQTQGSLIYQDVIYKPFGKKYQLSTRVAYSQIGAYGNRIYSYEQTPLYDYPLFTHGYSGLRCYILARYKPVRNLDVWFKYGLTKHDVPLDGNQEFYTIGSGLSEINGNQKHTFTLQLRYLIK